MGIITKYYNQMVLWTYWRKGTLVLKNTCPEVTPYNRNMYNHMLTNKFKAEHYLTSGLNKMPTSVSTISDCVVCFQID